MDLKQIEGKMQATIDNLEAKFITIRAGRANPGMVSGINIDYYGVATPLNSLANITVPEARQLFIKPFDRGALKAIEKAINEANLGINPVNNGEMIILTVPELTEDKRKDYVKMAKNLLEEAKVALRNIRQDANNSIKKEEMPEDEEKIALDDIQELIGKYNQIADDKLKEKEKELMSI